MTGTPAVLTLATLIGTMSVSFVGETPSIAAEAPSIASVVRIIYGPEPLDGFRYPDGITVDRDRGIFLVADTGNGRLVIFDEKWRSRGVIEFNPGPERKATSPRTAAIDSRGRLFVIDAYLPEIEIMSSRGVHLAYLPEILPEELEGRVHPQHMDIDPQGLIYLLYGGELPGFYVLDPRGHPVREVGFVPAGTGLFVAPMSLSVNDETGYVAVVDAQAEHSLMIFTPEGTLHAAFGGHGEGEGMFSMPVHVTWGPQETLWVTDTIRHSVSVFTKEGLFLGYIGGYGAGPGQFYYPIACEFLDDDRVLVLERAGARLQVLEVNPLDVASTNAGLE